MFYCIPHSRSMVITISEESLILLVDIRPNLEEYKRLGRTSYSFLSLVATVEGEKVIFLCRKIRRCYVKKSPLKKNGNLKSTNPYE